MLWHDRDTCDLQNASRGARPDQSKRLAVTLVCPMRAGAALRLSTKTPCGHLSFQILESTFALLNAIAVAYR